MTDEEQKGQSAEPTPEVQSDMPEPTPEPALPEKFQGKSPAEIVQMYQETESHLGKVKSELGETKKENEAYGNWYRQALAQQQQQAQQPPVDDSDRYLDDPARATREDIQKAQYQQRVNTGLSMSPLAINQAKTIAPQFFETEEQVNEVRNLVQQTVARGGMQPELLLDPETYTNAAGILWLKKNNFKTTSPAPSPTSPPQTDLPSQVKSPEGTPVALSEEHKRMVRDFGFKPEEVAEDFADEMENG